MKGIYILLSLIIFLTGASAQQKKEFTLDLKVNFTNAIPNDTLILDLIDPWTLQKTLQIKSTKDSQDNFVFKAIYSRPYGFWTLRVTRPDVPELMQNRTISEIFLWEDKDNIKLELSTEIGELFGHKSHYQFTGKGSLKYQTKIELDEDRKLAQTIPTYRASYFTDDFKFIPDINPRAEEQLILLNSRKNELSKIAYQSLKNDVIWQNPSAFGSKVSYYIQENSDNVTKFKDNYLRTTKQIFSLDSNSYFYYSRNSLIRFQEKLRTDLRVLIYPNKDISDNYYSFLKEHSSGEARERLLIHYFSYYRQAQNLDSLINDAVPLFESEEGIEEITKLKLPFPKSIGKGFQFIDHNGNIFNLDSLQGKVILIDVYNPGCSPCATLFKNSISKIKKELANDPKFVVVSVSVEQNNDRWLKSLESGLYTSFSNNTVNVYTGKVGKDHPFLKLNKWSYNPTVLLIDSDGQTRYINNDFFFHFEKLKPIIQQLLR